MMPYDAGASATNDIDDGEESRFAGNKQPHAVVKLLLNLSATVQTGCNEKALGADSVGALWTMPTRSAGAHLGKRLGHDDCCATAIFALNSAQRI
jgi:hypothetical protein